MRLDRSRTALGGMALTLAGAALVTGHTAANASDDGHRGVAASAGTVVFVKGENVWISRPDGTGQRQITTDGTYEWPYVSPSMADDGTIAVARRNEIIRMRQGGTVLNRMDPPPLPNAAGIATDGTPAQVAVSPNGAKVAYTFVQLSSGEGIPTAIRTVTGYTAADHLTDHTQDRLTYFTMPSWVGNARTLQSGGANFEVMVHDLGTPATHWFDSDEGFNDLELSPDGTRLAGAAGYQGNGGVAYYDVSGNATSGPVPAPPTYRCTFSDDAGPLISPTWGPDSKTLAFQANDGVYVAEDVTACGASAVTLLAPGAKTPDWSPAAYNPETPQTVTPTVDPTVDPTTSPQGTFTVAGKSKITGRLRVGKKVGVALGKVSPRPTTTSYQWTSNGKKIKKATKRTYRIKRGDRRSLLSVTVTLRRSGYTAKTLTVRAGRVR